MSVDATDACPPTNALDAALGKSGASTSGPLERFAFELQRRKVCRAAFSYSLLVWLNVQIGDVVFPMAGLPEWSLRFVVAIGLLGLPLVIFLAWTFQITPHGLRIDTGGNEAEAGPEAPSSRANLAISLLLLVLGIGLAGWLTAQRALGDDDLLAEVDPALPQEMLVTLVFHSAEGELVTAGIRHGLEAGLRHELIRLPHVTVLAGVESGETVAGSVGRLLVSGTLSVEEGRVHAVVDALDLRSGRYIWAKRFSCPSGSMTEVQNLLTKRILAEIKALLGLGHSQGSQPQDTGAAQYDGGLLV